MGSKQVVQIKLHATELEYYYKHETSQVKEDFNCLFNVVQDILNHATSIADKCLLGKNQTFILENGPVPSSNCALNVLKRICCTVACEADSKRDVSASIVDILSAYSGAERAVLALAAFALSYGELVFYVDRQQLNPFALLISSLRRVDEIIKVQQEDQFKTAIIELNDLTKLTLQLIGFIVELDNLSRKDCIDDMSLVTRITGIVENYSFLAIQVVVACMTQVNYLTYDRITTTGKGLSSLASALNDKLITLQETVETYKLLIVEWEAYSKLHTCFCSRSGIIEVMTCLMYPWPACLERYNEKPVRVDQLLKGKNALLFISDLDISKEDFSTLMIIHERLEKQCHDYKIIWIPIVEQWTPESLKKFDAWKKKMPWYVVCYEMTKPIVGIKYIKKRWQFSYKPMVVVINSQGAVECLDAMHMIRAWEIDAFPFTHRDRPDPCMGPIITTITNHQIEKETYIFLYGGTDEAWINDFGTKVTALARDSLVKAKITLTSIAIGGKTSNIKIEQFWTRIESLLCLRMQWNVLDDVTKQIQKLLSFKEEIGWAVLCKGPTILSCASGTIFKEAVAEYKEWTKYMEKKKFEICLQEYFDTKKIGLPCRHVPIQSFNGWLPVDVECPDCGERMERTVTYKCCHLKTSRL